MADAARRAGMSLNFVNEKRETLNERSERVIGRSLQPDDPVKGAVKVKFAKNAL
jgi:hypothetical protein